MQQLKDVMSRHVKMVSPDTTIREAAQQMRDGNFGMLPVAENDRMVGAISDRDVTHDDVGAGAARLARSVQHRVRLADARRVPDVDPQPTALHASRLALLTRS